LTDDAVSQYLNDIKKDGIIIYDPTSVSKVRAKKTQLLYSVPAQQIAREELHNPLTANVIIFMAFAALTGLLDKEAAINGVKDFVPAKAIDLNIQAFNVGYDYAMKLKTSS